MKIWYDACTGKHVRYGAAIARRFREKGHEVVFTTRAHPDTIPLAKLLHEEPVIVGSYAPGSLFSRLRESTRRIASLARLVKGSMPDVAIAHQSVELCRVAFGLGIPILLTADTPHAEAVNRLTVPLAGALVVSEGIPGRFYKRYGAQEILPFKGVDEVAWIKGLKPVQSFRARHPLIVIRQMETRASYALVHRDESRMLARKLAEIGNVLFIPRYNKESAASFIDSASIVAKADLVVSAGGTISREAALQGVPSIVASPIGRTYVNTYLARKGFPLFISNADKAVDLAKKLLQKQYNVKSRLAALENPIDTIERIAVQLVESNAAKVKASLHEQ